MTSRTTLSWAHGSGRAEVGAVVAEASVVNLGARGVIATGLPFLDHMIDQLTSHCQLGVAVMVTNGDGVACEPCKDASGTDDAAVAAAAGAALGQALRALLAPGVAAVASGAVQMHAARGVFSAPLDEAYSTCRLDLASASPTLTFALAPYGPGAGRAHIGKYQTQLTEPFWRALVLASGIELDLRKCRGDNAHHIVEATFKSFARCLRATMDQMEGVDVVASSSLMATRAIPARAASKARSTKETNIDVVLDLDGAANSSAVSTGIDMLDELLAAIAAEAGIKLNVGARGDLWIDDHHTTEDVAITVGQVLAEALGDKAGCNRMGRAVATVAGGEDVDDVGGEAASGSGAAKSRDEAAGGTATVAAAATVEVVMDLSNRPYLANGLQFRGEFVGDMSAEMIDHMFMSIATNGQMTVHIVEHSKGANDADLAAAAARAFGRCLRQCIAVDPRRAGAVASSKGTLSV